MISAFGIDHGDYVSKAVKDKTKRQIETGGAAVIGGGAAQGIYQGAAYGPKKAIRDYYGHNTKMSEFPKRAKPTKAEAAKTRLASSRVGRTAKIQPPKLQKDRKKAWESAKKAQTKAGIPPQGATKAKFYRTLPKTAPFARTQRVLGYTHAGKLGTAVGTGVTLAGAATAAAAVSRRKRR